MKEILIRKLNAYLVHNNPDVLVVLQGESNVTSYLKEKVNALDDLPEKLLADGKPPYIVEEFCMKELTAEFRPSRYNYILSVLEDEFGTECSMWQESGVLTYEIINLLQACNPVFDHLGFAEGDEDSELRYVIIGTIQQQLLSETIDREYLDKIDFRGL